MMGEEPQRQGRKNVAMDVFTSVSFIVFMFDFTMLTIAAPCLRSGQIHEPVAELARWNIRELHTNTTPLSLL
jgi:hypothetical protein